MSAYINLAAINTSTYSSESLGPLDSVAHPLEPGRYLGNLFRGKSHIGRFDIHVKEDGLGEQIEIDLAEIEEGISSTSFTSGLAHGQDIRTVFAVFHSGKEKSGYHVTLHALDNKKIYDSRKLSLGDYYIITPLYPGRYDLYSGTLKRNPCIVTVEKATPTDEPRASQYGVTLEATSELVNPLVATIVSGDGLVVKIIDDDVTIYMELAGGMRNRIGERRKVDVRYYGKNTASAE